MGTFVVPYRVLVWGGWYQKPHTPFLYFAFPGLEAILFHRGRSCGTRTARELHNTHLFPLSGLSWNPQVPLESIKINKLAFLTKARLSFRIYRHRV